MKLSFKEQIYKAKHNMQQELEEKISPVLINNTKNLLKLEDTVPYFKGRLVKKEIKDDAEYITFPLLGGMIVQKQKLNIAQVAVGGVMAVFFCASVCVRERERERARERERERESERERARERESVYVCNCSKN